MVFRRKRVEELIEKEEERHDRLKYLEQKLNQLEDESDDENSSGSRSEHRNDSVQEAEAAIQPVVISIYTSDAPRESHSSEGTALPGLPGHSKLLTTNITEPTTQVDSRSFLINETMMTEESVLPPSLVRIIPVTQQNEDWHDDDTLTTNSTGTDDDDEEDSTECTLSSIEDEDFVQTNRIQYNPDEDDDDKDGNLSVIPHFTDVIWNDVYRNCGIQTAETLTDQLAVHLPKKFSQYFSCNGQDRTHQDHRQTHHRHEEYKNKATRTMAAGSRSFNQKFRAGGPRSFNQKPSREKPAVPILHANKARQGEDHAFVAVWASRKQNRSQDSDDYSDGKASF